MIGDSSIYHKIRFRSVSPYLNPEHAIYEAIKNLDNTKPRCLDTLLDFPDEFEFLVNRYRINIQCVLPSRVYLVENAVLLPKSMTQDITLDDLRACIGQVSISKIINAASILPTSDFFL